MNFSYLPTTIYFFYRSLLGFLVVFFSKGRKRSHVDEEGVAHGHRRHGEEDAATASPGGVAAANGVPIPPSQHRHRSQSATGVPVAPLVATAATPPGGHHHHHRHHGEPSPLSEAMVQAAQAAPGAVPGAPGAMVGQHHHSSQESVLCT